jgi:hypothetical protein
MNLTWDYAGMTFTWGNVPVAMTWDYAARLAFCLVILAVGIWAWRRSMDRTPLFVGIAFGLFGVYYLVLILGLMGPEDALLLILRYVGYLIVIYALYAAGSRGLEMKMPEWPSSR